MSKWINEPSIHGVHLNFICDRTRHNVDIRLFKHYFSSTFFLFLELPFQDFSKKTEDLDFFSS